uniref:Immunoglobulin domain-containing protein n=1 Tax=Neolamprologus brichardi TaxID=32507 RepID=A0A3Q4GYI0_NEOBR
MRSFVLSTALFLSSLSWISVSGFEFQTVEVQLDEEVTLKCSNISSHPSQTDWFKVINRTKPSCIAAMYGSQGKASFCDGFRNGKFNMSSNNTSVFLKITQVDLSDVGLYFCGFYVNKHTVISNAVELRIQGKLVGRNFLFQFKEPGNTHVMSIVLSGVTGLFAVVVIVLVLKILNLQTGKNCCIVVPPLINDLNYAAMSFQTKLKRSRRPATHRELESHVVYAATR